MKLQISNVLKGNKKITALITEASLYHASQCKCPNYITQRSGDLTKQDGCSAILKRQDIQAFQISPSSFATLGSDSYPTQYCDGIY
jgi:hypothetical protein